MKRIFLFTALIPVLLSNSDCSKKKNTGVRYKGKLEIAGICMNYTIRLTEGSMDTAAIAGTWTDPSTNQIYSNVFRLGNPCDFPATIKQGDEFYFTRFTGKENQCAVCMAYYPTPAKSLSIRIAE